MSNTSTKDEDFINFVKAIKNAFNGSGNDFNDDLFLAISTALDKSPIKKVSKVDFVDDLISTTKLSKI